jgi:hypothetical protein
MCRAQAQLDLPEVSRIFTPMKRFSQWLALTSLAICLSSCAALGRTVSNTYNSFKNIIPSASATGSSGGR